MRKILMKDAEQFRDTVSAKLCNCLYEACKYGRKNETCNVE